MEAHIFSSARSGANKLPPSSLTAKAAQPQEDVISASWDTASTACNGWLSTSNSTPISGRVSLLSRPLHPSTSTHSSLGNHASLQTSPLVPTSSPSPSNSSWANIRSFIVATCNSKLLASALSAVTAASAHPQITTCCPTEPLQWTLAAMLTLHLRSGRQQLSEEDLIALLWTLESWNDSSRSAATTVLGDYTRHLAAFDEPRAIEMTANWRESFFALRSAVAASQRTLLTMLDWKVNMSDEEVAVNYRVLFDQLPSFLEANDFDSAVNNSNSSTNITRSPSTSISTTFSAAEIAAINVDALAAAIAAPTLPGLTAAGAMWMASLCASVHRYAHRITHIEAYQQLCQVQTQQAHDAAAAAAVCIAVGGTDGILADAESAVQVVCTPEDKVEVAVHVSTDYKRRRMCY